MIKGECTRKLSEGITGERRWNIRREIHPGHRNSLSISQMQMEAGLTGMSAMHRLCNAFNEILFGRI